MNGISPAILATSAVASGVVAFVAGFLLGAPTSHAEDRTDAIVDPHAWEVAGPQPAPEPRRTAIADCSPWDVSDTAIEAVLDEMQRRGWRPPTEVEEILADADLMRAWRDGEADSRQGAASIAVVSDAVAAQLWDDEPETAMQPSKQPVSLISSN